MKILVTGGNGQLGRALKKVLPKKDAFFIDKEQMDITDKKEVLKKITKIKPQIIIHAAAYTDVDGAEQNKKLAFKINRDGAANVAAAAKKINAIIVYVSTDFVFNGRKKSAYSETDKPNPQSIYGQSKYQGELAVQKILKKYFIVRTSWLYGEGPKNFPTTILTLAKNHKEIKVVDDQIGSPTYAKDLAEFIAKIISQISISNHKNNLFGLYHFSNIGFCSWAKYAKEILKLTGNKSIKIVSISSHQWQKIKPDSAPRPKFSQLNCNKAIITYKIKIRPWQKALLEFLKN